MAGQIFVVTKTITGVRSYVNQTVLTFRIDYPQFVTYVSQASVRSINANYRRQAMDLAREIQARCYLQAAGDYLRQAEQGTPFVPHEFHRTFTVTYDLDCIISLYLDEFKNTGSANGCTLRTSDTWNTTSGERITLEELFPRDIDYQAALTALIETEIEARLNENPSSYFPDYSQRVQQSFSERNFYMTPEALVVYFQEGEIAPPQTGIPVFPIPYQMLFILLPTC